MVSARNIQKCVENSRVAYSQGNFNEIVISRKPSLFHKFREFHIQKEIDRFEQQEKVSEKLHKLNEDCKKIGNTIDKFSEFMGFFFPPLGALMKKMKPSIPEIKEVSIEELPDNVRKSFEKQKKECLVKDLKEFLVNMKE